MEKSKHSNAKRSFSKLALVLILIVLFIFFWAGGTAYWLFLKAKTVAHTALNVSKNPVTVPTVEPTSTQMAMPAFDVAGEDLTVAPRYPNSIRTSYYLSDDQNFVTDQYMAPAGSSLITDYYKKILESGGWVLESSDQRTFQFLRDSDELTLLVESENNNLTLYSLSWTKTPVQ